MEVRSRREANVEVKNNEIISAIFLFIRVLYLKQQNNILPCFCSLKFENSLFSSKLSNCIIRSKRIVYTTKKVYIKYVVQNWLVKRALFYVQTVAWLCCYCHKSWFFKFMEYTVQETAVSWNVLNHKRLPYQMENII